MDILERDQHNATTMIEELEDQLWPREAVEPPCLEILKAQLDNLPVNLL